MGPKVLTDLPPELQCAIVECIPRRTDLKSLCLSCKALRYAALPKLYHTVTINLDECQLPALNGFFITSNPGCPYTRRLWFESPRLENQDTAWSIMSLALQCLTRDSLVEIHAPPGMVFDLAFLLTLSGTQRKMKTIYLSSGGDCFVSAAKSPMFTWDWIQDVEALILPSRIEGVEDLVGYHELIKRAGKLSDLSLRTYLTKNKDFNKLYQEKAQADGLLLKTLFGHIAPFGQLPALRLDRLDLWKTHLQHATPKLTTVVDFKMLRILNLWECSGADTLLCTLMATENVPPLQYLSYCGAALTPALIERFLKSFTGLTTLRVKYNAKAVGSMFDLACLETHGQSLDRLVLHLLGDAEADQGPTPLSSAEVSLLCKYCTELREVALTLPLPQVGDIGGPGGSILRNIVDELCKMKSLRLLKILDWPRIPNRAVVCSLQYRDQQEATVGDVDELCRTANQLQVLKEVDTLATKVFYGLSVSKGTECLNALPNLVFGTSIFSRSYAMSEDFEVKVPMKAVYYLPTLQKDRLGRSSIKAERSCRHDCTCVGEFGDCNNVVHKA